METYRVVFDNNRPVYARPISQNEKSKIGEISKGKKKQVEWLAVEGYDEEDSINLANEIMQLLKKYL